VPRLSVLLLSLSLLAQDQLTVQEKRGLQIFEDGTSASGNAIDAFLVEGTHVPASVLPCVNCHGHDGQGRPEGGIIPSNISWSALTKPYGLTHPNGRTHPAYTERSLRRAITMGIDPAGNPLSGAMPRFQLSMADATDLIAYLKKLDQVVDPGLTDTAVQLGVILPAPSQTSNTNRIIRQALLHCFARVNGAGGVFGRRIELTFVELPADAGQRSDAILAFLHKEQVFAVVGADITGSELEIATIMRNTSTPAIAALAAFPQIDSPLNRYVFYLDGGVKEEAEALLRFAAEKVPGEMPRIAIMSADEENSREAAKWLEARLKSQPGREIVTEVQHAHPPDLVFWLNPGSRLPSFVTHGNGETTFLIPASLGGEEGFPPQKSRVFVALHALSQPQDWAPNSKSADELNWRRATASAEIMTEAMTRAGLIDALEGFYNVQTSLATPVSFGPNRRVGVSDVRVMMVDPHRGELVPIQDGPL
jgi:hypothetical protein